MFTAIENNPIIADLLAQAKTTGWTVDGITATHDSCNAGSIILNNYPVIGGQSYKISYFVPSVSGGYLQAQTPGSNGSNRTTPGLYVETLSPTSNGNLSFYSNTNCTLQMFNIQNTFNSNSNTQENTLVYSVKNKKWGDFRTIAPDFGFSIYIDMVTLYQGNLYLHQNGSASRNNFYGTQYQTIFKYVENTRAEELKSYNSIALQSNQLMVTTVGGITTSLGQVSELIEQDFIKSVLNDGVTSINVESVTGIYSASFLRDKNVDLINGDQLKGNYIIITLTTLTGNTTLRLFSIAVNASKNNIGTR